MSSELQGELPLATGTIDLVRTIISRKKLSTLDELIEHIQHIGKTLTDAKPDELVPGNIVRRILHQVRALGKELVDEIEQEEEKERSLHASVAPSPSASPPRSLSSSPPPSTLLKRSFSSVNMDVSLSLHSLLDQPSNNTSPALSHAASADDLSSSSLSPNATTASPSAPPPLFRPVSQPPLTRQRSKPDPRLTEEERQQREFLATRLKPDLIEELNSLTDEVKQSASTISDMAVQHVYAGEVILTYGLSGTVVAFLKAAARVKRRFEVMVVETAPDCSGHAQAMALSSEPFPIETTVIADSAVYALMPAVNKVIIGCHAVMANGSLLLQSGGYNICLAASCHSVPVVVLTGLHKLSVLYSHGDDRFNVQQAPSHVLQYGTLTASPHVRINNPLHDEVAVDYVSLLITNEGGHNPSYIYRLLSDRYHSGDYVLRGRGGGGGGEGEERDGVGGLTMVRFEDEVAGGGRNGGRLGGIREKGGVGGGKGKVKERKKGSGEYRNGIDEERNM